MNNRPANPPRPARRGHRRARRALLSECSIVDARGAKWQTGLLASICILLGIAALLGGSSYLSAPGWRYLFMAGCLGSAIGLSTLGGGDRVRPCRGILLFGTACCLLPALQLVPLPPEVWQALPGRNLIKAVDDAGGIDAPWRPLSLVPAMTEHALMGMLVPLALLLHAVQLDDRHQEHLLWLVLLLILGSALLAIAQTQAPALQAVLGYKRAGADVATGLFSNRNHQALLIACALPLLMAAVSLRAGWLRHQGPVAIPAVVAGGTLILFAMILVTGSRAGLLLYGVAVAALPFLWPYVRSSASNVRTSPRLRTALGLGSGALLLVLVFVIANDNGRAIALARLLEQDPADELRPVIYAQTMGFLGTYWPAGTGIGTFIPIYALEEPAALMRPAYVNQAHNDWLDIALTGGAAGAILLLSGSLYMAFLASRHVLARSGQSRGRIFGRCASLVILLVGLASIVDFPLRTPLMMSILAIVMPWVARPPQPALLCAPDASGKSRPHSGQP